MTDEELAGALRPVLLEFGKGCSMAGARSLYLSVGELIKTSRDPAHDRHNPGSCQECLESASRAVLSALHEAGFCIVSKDECCTCIECGSKTGYIVPKEV